MVPIIIDKLPMKAKVENLPKSHIINANSFQATIQNLSFFKAIFIYACLFIYSIIFVIYPI